MTNDHVLQLIAAAGAVSAFITALAALLSSMRNRTKLVELHLTMNSRLDELLRQRGISAHAEGVAEERARHAE